MAKLYSSDRDVRRAAAEARHRGAAADDPHPHLDLQHDPGRQVDRRPAARLPDVDHVAQPRQRDDRRCRAGADRRRPRRATTCRSATTGSRRSCSGLDRLEHYDRFAPVADDASKTSLGRGAARRRRCVQRLLGRGRRGRRAVLRRRLDRRSGAARQAPRRVLRHQRAGRPPVRLHELHGRPPLDPHARPRARPRAARRRWRSRSGSSTPRRR